MENKELVIVEGEAITQSAITDEQMNRTLKVTQRTMKQRLKAELDKLSAIQKEKKIGQRKTWRAFAEAMQPLAEEEINSGNFGLLEVFEALNDFCCSGLAGNTEDFVFGCIEDMVYGDVEIYGRGMIEPNPENALDEHDCVKFNVALNLDFSDESDGWSGRPHKQIGIGLTAETDKLHKAAQAAYDELEDATAACQACVKKLDDIDTVVEQMETKLLTEELKKTEGGKAFLQSVVGSMEEFLSDGKHINLIEGVKSE